MKAKTIVMWLGGIWLSSIGFKFVLGYIFGWSMPHVPTLDLFIDWIPALCFGIALIFFAVNEARSVRVPEAGLKPVTTSHPGTRAARAFNLNRGKEPIEDGMA